MQQLQKLKTIKQTYKCELDKKRKDDYLRKRMLGFVLPCMIMMTMGVPVAAAPIVTEHISVNGYDSKADYMAEMKKCLDVGNTYALQVGAIYEKQRNYKIDTLNLDLKKTAYFSHYSTAEDIRAAMERDTNPKYTQEDLDLLSRVIYAEAGCEWFPNWVQRAVGSVVLNRVKDKRYPNNIKEVLWQPGQYGCVTDGNIYRTPTKKCIDNAKAILENGSTLPEGVIGQSGNPLGPVHSSYYDSVLGTTIYFFYV